MTEATDKTHYRKAFNSPYLSSADIVEPTVLTIKHVKLANDATKKTKDSFNTAHFVESEIRKGEKLKPMILNATNSRTLKELTSSPFIEDWINIAVTIYVDGSVRFGRDTVEGLRISSVKPAISKTKPVLTPESERWAGAVQSAKDNGKVEAVLEHVDMSDLHIKQMKDEAGL